MPRQPLNGRPVSRDPLTPNARTTGAAIALIAAAACSLVADPGFVTPPSSSAASTPSPSRPFDLAERVAEHWAWRENSDVQPPAVRDAAWPADDLDRFVLARLEAAGLRPAPPADPVPLLRRVSFDLTGLPPTPDEIDAFLADAAADPSAAYERVVDRLLASPRFGERWARHWLDLVRYAETYGHEADFPIPHAWRYRDYVIRALNADVPYDRFVREHVAGDLLGSPRIDPDTGVDQSAIATGWWYLHEQTHAPTDARQHQADRVDNQIDTFGKAFLGLTVACARCHDHKFDAISQRDYYALAGFLHSSRQQEAYLDAGGKIAAGVAALRAIKAEADATMAAIGAPMPAAPASEGRPHDAAGAAVFESFNAGRYDGWFTTGWAWGDAPTRPGQWDRSAAAASPARPGVAHSGQLGPQPVGTLWSPTFPLNRRQVAMRVAGKGVVRLIIDGYTIEPNVSLLFNETRKVIDTGGRWQWVVMGGDVALYAGGEHRAFLQFIDDDPAASLAVDEVRFTDGPLERDGDGEPASSPSASPPHDAAFAAFASRMDAVAVALPAPQRAVAITDGTGEDRPVADRGSWRTPGELAPRRYLPAITGVDQPPAQPPAQSPLDPAAGSGRLQLADRMLDARGAPFVSRTMVNRICQHLIGRGIAPTVDDFGALGERPTHPQLLDRLSADFRRDGWSIKRMIRRVVLSSTYRMSSAPADAAAELADPANALLHRMNVKRLEGEAIRDAVLAISGRLDPTMFGPSVPIHLTPYMGEFGRPKESGPLDGAGRRSIYVEVRRNFLSPMMLAFDTPPPFGTVGRRNVSNVPAQSLILLNDPFIAQQAALWARRAIAAESDPARRIILMHRQAFARSPSAADLAAAVAFVQGRTTSPPDDAALAAWSDYAHVLLNVKGFIYVE